MVGLCCSFDLYWGSGRGLLSLFFVATLFPKIVGILYCGEIYLPIRAGQNVSWLKKLVGRDIKTSREHDCKFCKLINFHNWKYYFLAKKEKV